jgi:hypothetical protein
MRPTEVGGRPRFREEVDGVPMQRLRLECIAEQEGPAACDDSGEPRRVDRGRDGLEAVHRRESRRAVPTALRGLDEIGELVRGDVEERFLDEGRQSLEGVAIVPGRDVLDRHGPHTGRVHAAEPEGEDGLGDTEHGRRRRPAPGELRRVHDVFGRKPHRATNLADVLERPICRGGVAAAEAEQALCPESGVEDAERPALPRHPHEPVQEVVTGLPVPERRAEHRAEGAVVEDVVVGKCVQGGDGGSESWRRLGGRIEDEGSERREDDAEGVVSALPDRRPDALTDRFHGRSGETPFSGQRVLEGEEERTSLTLRRRRCEGVGRVEHLRRRSRDVDGIGEEGRERRADGDGPSPLHVVELLAGDAVDEIEGEPRRSRQAGGLGGVEKAGGSSGARGGEVCGAGEESGARGEPAAPPGAVGDLLQPIRRVVVHTERRLGAVPRGEFDETTGERLRREGRVSATPVLRRGSAVDGRADERVPEADRRAHRDEGGGFGGGRGSGRDP